MQDDREPDQLSASVRPLDNGQQALELVGAGQSVVFWPVDTNLLRELARRLEVIAAKMEKGAQGVIQPGSDPKGTGEPKATLAASPAAALEAVQKAIDRRGPRRNPR
jgi:hypothetical protein